MNRQEELQKRLKNYRAILQKSQAHSVALDNCRKRSAKTWSEYDEIFLHVFAPVLTEYVEWILQEAVQAGKRRLYFLARDGWLMYLAAEKLAESKNLPLEVRYLKVSRYALRTAEYYLLGDGCLDTVCVGGIDITFQKLMKRAALTEEEAKQIAELTGYEKRYQTILNYTEIQKLKTELKQIKPFFDYVKEHSAACYNNAVGYLKQEGLLSNIPYGIVDSGWVGTTQMSLENLLSSVLGKRKTVEGYYFGLYELPKAANPAQYHSFYIIPGKSLKRKARFSICLFETICSSPAGMTLGYQKQDGQYISVESERRNPNAAFMERNKEALLTYIMAYETEPVRRLKHSDIEKLLKACMGTPTEEEAEQLGALLFCDDVLELQIQKVAADWSSEEIRKQSFLNKLLNKVNLKKEELHESGWPEGSITISGGNIRANLRQERLYKYFMYIRKAI